MSHNPYCLFDIRMYWQPPKLGKSAYFSIKASVLPNKLDIARTALQKSCDLACELIDG
jgi:hypothetical protein